MTINCDRPFQPLEFKSCNNPTVEQMNSENVVQTVQKGFHVTIGATNFLFETLQDPQKRDENLSRLREDFNVLSEEWAIVGARKEQEARTFVETLVGQTGESSSGSRPSGFSTPNPPPVDVTVSGDTYRDLKELIAELAAVRTELEKLREP